MHVNDIAGIFLAIIILAMVSVALGSKNTAAIIKAWMDGFGHDVAVAK